MQKTQELAYDRYYRAVRGSTLTENSNQPVIRRGTNRPSVCVGGDICSPMLYVLQCCMFVVCLSLAGADMMVEV